MLYMKFRYMGISIHRSTQTTDPMEAQKVIERVKRGISNQGVDASSTPQGIQLLFADAIEEVYKERWIGNTSREDTYKTAYRILDILGNIPVVDIDTKKVRLVQAQLRGQYLSDSTVNGYMKIFRTVLKHAAESYNLPYPKFNLKKINNGRIRIYSSEEENAIINWFVTHDLKEMAYLTAVLIDTGLRLSECLGIGKRNKARNLISEVNITRNRVTSWINKGDKPRTIPLTKRASAIFKSRGRVPFSYNKNQFERLWKKMRDGLGLEKDSVAHACRHTCASRLLETGSSLLVVKEWLGHLSIETTLIYCHLAPDELVQAAARLDVFSSQSS